MQGFESNHWGGTTLRHEGEVYGFTMRQGTSYVAYAARGRNITGLGAYATNEQAVARVRLSRQRGTK